MNEFIDFHVIAADQSLYRHCRGYSGCSLGRCRPAFGHHLFGLRWLARFLVCDATPRTTDNIATGVRIGH